jgi:hypothetical protein
VASGKIARMPRRLALTLVPAFHLALASCATNPVTGGQDFALVSKAQELRISRQVHAQSPTPSATPRKRAPSSS